MAKSSNKVVEAAYAQVNNILKRDVKNPEHQKVISTALTDVWSYAGLFPGENESLKTARLEMDSPADGEYSELAGHFRELYPEDFAELAAPAVIFVMYNRMKDLGANNETKTTESVAVEGNVAESSDTSNKSFKEEKETKIMSEKKHLLNIGDVTEEMNTPGADITLNGSMPTQASKATLDAVAQKFNESTAVRKQYSQKSVIEKFVVGSPALKERLVAKENVMGKIKDPAKVKESFIKKFGVTVAEDGTVTFAHVAAGDEAKALSVWNDINKAVEDPEMTFAVKVGNSTGSVKGVRILEEGEQSSRFITIAQLTDILINKAFWVLNTPNPEVQAQITKARTSQTTATNGSGIQKTKKSNKNPYAGVTSVKFIGRNKAEDMTVFHKEKTDEVQLLGGLKSEVEAKYYRGEADQFGNRKTMTFRIPLVADQYVTKVVDEDMREVYGDGTGLAGTQTTIDLTDETALNKIADDIIGAIADAAAAGKQGTLFDAIRTMSSAAEEASAQEQADEFGGLQ